VELIRSQEYVVHTPTKVVTYEIRQRDWEKIRRDIQRTIPEPVHWDRAMWGCIGVAGTGLAALVGLWASEKVPAAAWIVAISGTLTALILAVAFYRLHRRQRPAVEASVGDICAYMDAIVAELRPDAAGSSDRGPGSSGAA
jgi:hypothetical protein